jgi:hypothetical protein
MKVILKPDEAVAKVWDDYLHRFGAEEYVMARYLTPPTTMPVNEDPSIVLRRPSRVPP